MSILGHTMCIAVAALVINLVLGAVFTLVFRLARLPDSASRRGQRSTKTPRLRPPPLLRKESRQPAAADPRAAQ